MPNNKAAIQVPTGIEEKARLFFIKPAWKDMEYWEINITAYPDIVRGAICSVGITGSRQSWIY